MVYYPKFKHCEITENLIRANTVQSHKLKYHKYHFNCVSDNVLVFSLSSGFVGLVESC